MIAVETAKRASLREWALTAFDLEDYGEGGDASTAAHVAKMSHCARGI
jgi:hypothetical protein